MFFRDNTLSNLISGVKVEKVCAYNIILRDTRIKLKGKVLMKNQEKQPNQNPNEKEEPGYSTGL